MIKSGLKEKYFTPMYLATLVQMSAQQHTQEQQRKAEKSLTWNCTR